MKLINQIIGNCFVVAAALAISASTTQAQVLVNPDFEDQIVFPPPPGPDQGWVTFGTATVSGGYLHAWQSLGSDFTSAGAYQIDSGAIAGETYTFSCWYMSDTGVTLDSPVGLEIGFLNSALVDIGTVEAGPGNNSGGFNYTIPSNNTWYQGSVTGTAPAGSEYLVVYAMFTDYGQTTTENVYFDDASLTVVPEPSSLALIGMGLAMPFYFIRRRNG